MRLSSVDILHSLPARHAANILYGRSSLRSGPVVSDVKFDLSIVLTGF